MSQTELRCITQHADVNNLKDLRRRHYSSVYRQYSHFVDTMDTYGLNRWSSIDPDLIDTNQSNELKFVRVLKDRLGLMADFNKQNDYGFRCLDVLGEKVLQFSSTSSRRGDLVEINSRGDELTFSHKPYEHGELIHIYDLDHILVERYLSASHRIEMKHQAALFYLRLGQIHAETLLGEKIFRTQLDFHPPVVSAAFSQGKSI
ncbi:MAG: hypothetical protein U1C50_01925 [Patescibacteria group bacterium]|nr:hypothetical protein [Patescibacteria group bacterium]MDZ4228993.1 hypothetical protein [Patescibacteria group bacterium]